MEKDELFEEIVPISEEAQRQILQQDEFDCSRAAIDRFLSDEQNKPVSIISCPEFTRRTRP